MKLLAAVWSVVLFLFLLLILTMRPSEVGAAEFSVTPCDEWANFSKIITYRFRDNGYPRQQVKSELNRLMGGAPEIEVAQGWVDYSFDHPELNAEEVWKGVFKECGRGQF
jgi:hypothetical protein